MSDLANVIEETKKLVELYNEPVKYFVPKHHYEEAKKYLPEEDIIVVEDYIMPEGYHMVTTTEENAKKILEMIGETDETDR